MDYTDFRGTDPDPVGMQTFVKGDPTGSCSTELADPASADSDTLSLTISLEPTDSDAKRCGFEVVSFFSSGCLVL